MKHPALPELRFYKQHEGDKVNLQDIEGNETMSGYEKFESGLEVQMTELYNYDDKRWLVELEKMTDEFANSQMKLLLQKVGEAAESSGNVIDGGGNQLDDEHLLRVFEKVQLDFEGDEIAPGYAFIVAPGIANRLAELGKSEDFQKKYERIVENQRIAFRLRQADRKLVD